MKFRLLSSKREVKIVPISFGLVKKRVAKWPIWSFCYHGLYQCAGKRTFATPKPNPNHPKPSFFQKKRSKVPKTQKTGCAYSEHYTN